MAQKPFSLDYSIYHDYERCEAIRNILDKMPTDPSNRDCELMADYILYGKDDEDKNLAQRGLMTTSNARFNSFKKKEDKNESLEALLEKPTTDESTFQPLRKTYIVKRKPTIQHPIYDKKTGELLDPGDSDVPGMTQLWESIDRLDKWLKQNDGTLPPDEHTNLNLSSYQLFKLKHQIIQLRTDQYLLKEAYKPTIHWVQPDHPKPQFVDWCADATYYESYENWFARAHNPLYPNRDKNLDNYETKITKDGQILVKNVVRAHTFDWTNPIHIRALLSNYDLLHAQFENKLDTYAYTLLHDLDFYIEKANFTPLRLALIEWKKLNLSYAAIQENLEREFGIRYQDNHLSNVYSREIPNKIARAATKHHLIVDTPDNQKQKCNKCGRNLPLHTLFFTHNKNRKCGFSTICKDCDKKRRIEKGGSTYDRRTKETPMH